MRLILLPFDVAFRRWILGNGILLRSTDSFLKRLNTNLPQFPVALISYFQTATSLGCRIFVARYMTRPKTSNCIAVECNLRCVELLTIHSLLAFLKLPLNHTLPCFLSRFRNGPVLRHDGGRWCAEIEKMCKLCVNFVSFCFCGIRLHFLHNIGHPAGWILISRH